MKTFCVIIFSVLNSSNPFSFGDGVGEIAAVAERKEKREEEEEEEEEEGVEKVVVAVVSPSSWLGKEGRRNHLDTGDRLNGDGRTQGHQSNGSWWKGKGDATTLPTRKHQVRCGIREKNNFRN